MTVKAQDVRSPLMLRDSRCMSTTTPLLVPCLLELERSSHRWLLQELKALEQASQHETQWCGLVMWVHK
jgi:hypothetical protein